VQHLMQQHEQGGGVVAAKSHHHQHQHDGAQQPWRPQPLERLSEQEDDALDGFVVETQMVRMRKSPRWPWSLCSSRNAADTGLRAGLRVSQHRCPYLEAPPRPSLTCTAACRASRCCSRCTQRQQQPPPQEQVRASSCTVRGRSVLMVAASS
jgi:hypothetical protein